MPQKNGLINFFAKFQYCIGAPPPSKTQLYLFNGSCVTCYLFWLYATCEANLRVLVNYSIINHIWKNQMSLVAATVLTNKDSKVTLMFVREQSPIHSTSEEFKSFHFASGLISTQETRYHKRSNLVLFQLVRKNNIK